MTSVISKLDPDEDVIVELSPNNRYIRYQEVLSFGAYKIVYKGFDKDNGTEVAWNKFSLTDFALNSPTHYQRLVLEAAKIKLLKHGNIARCCDSWVNTEKRTVNMITELCCSGSLREFRMKHKGVDMKAIKKWARQILQGLCYLHSQNPPVVHGDLNCDNVFINGNGGEVKIGGLGFLTILGQGVAGTFKPEFMAPEVYEGACDQFVDIYAFGMCVLELVTCEYPYSECKSPGQRYRKIVCGVKPDALGRVKNLQAKDFIEKCLVPASRRMWMSAAELLNDPFLSCENANEPLKLTVRNLLPPKSSVAREISSSHVRISMESTWSKNAMGACVLVTEFYISKGNKEWRLSGEKADDNSISFVLFVKGPGLPKRLKFEYTFFPKTENAVSVAEELVSCNQELSKEDMAPTTMLMDTLLLLLVPGWKPSNCGVEYASPENDQNMLQSCREILRAGEEALENDKKRLLSGRMPSPLKSVLSR